MLFYRFFKKITYTILVFPLWTIFYMGVGNLFVSYVLFSSLTLQSRSLHQMYVNTLFLLPHVLIFIVNSFNELKPFANEIHSMNCHRFLTELG